MDRDVAFAEPAPGAHAAIDAAYHSKYDRYGPRIVGSVVGPDAEAANMVAFAMSQPEGVDVNEILYRPTAQEL
jgi:NADP-dependent 3-hydroxy acid dehydrogenase YdfG